MGLQAQQPTALKRIRCPKCDHYVIFDDTKYTEGQSLVFQCDQCGKQFGIKIAARKPATAANCQEANPTGEGELGAIIVIENVFHYKQEIPLRMGDNVIGRYQKGNPVSTPIETVDPSVDLNHCTVNVSRDKHGKLRYTLADNNSNTGTFVDNIEVKGRERRIITDGTLFTIGATSIILRAAE